MLTLREECFLAKKLLRVSRSQVRACIHVCMYVIANAYTCKFCVKICMFILINVILALHVSISIKSDLHIHYGPCVLIYLCSEVIRGHGKIPTISVQRYFCLE